VKALFQLLSTWPLALLHLLGALLGWLTWLLSPTYRRRFAENARQAGYRFAEVRPAVAEAGKLVAETPRLWFGRMPAIQWEHDDLISELRAQGRGIVFLTPHLGCFEVTAQAYAARFGPITVLYRPARKAWLQDLVATSRDRPRMTAVPTTLAGVRQMLRALRAGEAVGLLPDQVPPRGLGVWAPFFGRDAYTMTLPARLVQQTGAAVLLVWGERLPRGGAPGPRNTCGAMRATSNRARRRSREPSGHPVHAHDRALAAVLGAGHGLRAGPAAVLGGVAAPQGGGHQPAPVLSPVEWGAAAQGGAGHLHPRGAVLPGPRVAVACRPRGGAPPGRADRLGA
jgi:Kdo2-lipid IVA lauroyltransferase/acyltransferase